MAGTPPTVRAERSGRVMTVTLHNPPRNFMTGAMVQDLLELVRTLEGDRSIGAVVITGGVEGAFITHFDVAEIVAGVEDGVPQVSSLQADAGLRVAGALKRVPQGRSLVERTPLGGTLGLHDIHELFLRMNRLDKVFIAAINGMAMGGGCELALACDLRLMAKGDYLIGLPESTLGIIPGAGGTQRLARALGAAAALEMMLEGRVLKPAEAEKIGLVHRAVARTRLLPEAKEAAERLARRSPVAIGALKRAVYEGASRSLAEGLRMERAGFMAATSSPAARRALSTYAREVAEAGPMTHAEIAAMFERWHEGRVVDMVEEEG